MTGATGTPGPSVRVDVCNGIAQVVSSPLPMHRGDVTYSRMIHRWIVIVHTARVHPRAFRTMPEALRHAGTVIGALYRLDMRARFTGPQRAAMGMGQCPAHIACGEPTCTLPDGHHHICRRNPDVLSVWCGYHARQGERRNAL